MTTKKKLTDCDVNSVGALKSDGLGFRHSVYHSGDVSKKWSGNEVWKAANTVNIGALLKLDTWGWC